MSTIKLKRYPSATWTANNPVLADGEPGVELDTNRIKVGDNVTAWNDLPYYLNEDEGPGLMAYASNESNTPTTFSSTATNIFGCVIGVPPSPRSDVVLEWGGSVSISALPVGNNGFASLVAYEITGGTATIVDFTAAPIRSTDAVGDILSVSPGRASIGASNNYRTFALYGLCNKTSGSTYPTAKTINYPVQQRSYICAVKR